MSILDDGFKCGHIMTRSQPSGWWCINEEVVRHKCFLYLCLALRLKTNGKKKERKKRKQNFFDTFTKENEANVPQHQEDVSDQLRRTRR